MDPNEPTPKKVNRENVKSEAFGWSVRAWIAVLLTLGILGLVFSRIEVPTWLQVIYGMIMTHYYSQNSHQAKPAPATTPTA